jgi:glycyl-tRNA synthetase
MTAPQTEAKSMDDIMALCKRRGFIFQASEIYGGIKGFWDYGPLGAQLKKNLRDAWWNDVVMLSCNGQDGPDGKPVRIVGRRFVHHPEPEGLGGIGACRGLQRPDGRLPRVEEALPRRPPDVHVGREGRARKGRSTRWPRTTRAVREELTARKKLDKYKKRTLADDEIDHVHPDRSTILTIRADASGPDAKESARSPSRAQFNLMFNTFVGARPQRGQQVAYLRPETAQGIFINFKNVRRHHARQGPLRHRADGQGLPQRGHARNFTFRSREFEQMEIEFFCHAR